MTVIQVVTVLVAARTHHQQVPACCVSVLVHSSHMAMVSRSMLLSVTKGLVW